MLGVDFMSENVRAILDEAGHKDVAVYRMAAGAHVARCIWRVCVGCVLTYPGMATL